MRGRAGWAARPRVSPPDEARRAGSSSAATAAKRCRCPPLATKEPARNRRSPPPPGSRARSSSARGADAAGGGGGMDWRRRRREPERTGGRREASPHAAPRLGRSAEESRARGKAGERASWAGVGVGAPPSSPPLSSGQVPRRQQRPEGRVSRGATASHGRAGRRAERQCGRACCGESPWRPSPSTPLRAGKRAGKQAVAGRQAGRQHLTSPQRARGAEGEEGKSARRQRIARRPHGLGVREGASRCLSRLPPPRGIRQELLGCEGNRWRASLSGRRVLPPSPARGFPALPSPNPSRWRQLGFQSPWLAHANRRTGLGWTGESGGIPPCPLLPPPVGRRAVTHGVALDTTFKPLGWFFKTFLPRFAPFLQLQADRQGPQPGTPASKTSNEVFITSCLEVEKQHSRLWNK
ncbi:uncharacterized protein LOC143820879 [Paroedura picta]|uniref:uncharacterized protein LOC143820879 n=1 Tax=Paroedura picta TaxID=143630 RepID=UPI00405641C8